MHLVWIRQPVLPRCNSNLSQALVCAFFNKINRGCNLAMDEWIFDCSLRLHDYFLHCWLVLQPLQKLKSPINSDRKYRPVFKPITHFSFIVIKQIQFTYFPASLQKTLLPDGYSYFWLNFSVLAALLNLKNSKNFIQIVVQIIWNHNFFEVRLPRYNNGMARVYKRKSKDLWVEKKGKISNAWALHVGTYLWGLYKAGAHFDRNRVHPWVSGAQVRRRPTRGIFNWIHFYNNSVWSWNRTSNRNKFH